MKIYLFIEIIALGFMLYNLHLLNQIQKRSLKSNILKELKNRRSDYSTQI